MSAQQVEAALDFADDVFAESTVEDGNTVIRNVLLCGNVSKNGYKLPPSAFRGEQGAKDLYEGRQVFIDHDLDDRGRPRPTRKIAHLAGVVTNVRFVEGKPRGDVDTKDAPQGSLLLTLAKSRMPGVGFSHVAAYRLNKSTNTVESVLKVASVDCVCGPATTQSFYENDHTVGEGDAVSDQAVDLLNEKNEKLEKELREAVEAKTAVDKELADAKSAVESVTKERDALKVENDNFKAADALRERRVAVETELKDAGFDVNDDVVCSETFVNTLVGMSDAAVRKAHIEDRKAILGNAVESRVGSTERQAGQSETFDPAKVEVKFA